MTNTLAVEPRRATRWRRIRGPVLLAGGLLVASVALHVRDPHQGGSWGLCPWLVLTGTYCPGCGGLRAVNDLTRGELGAAASSNLLLVGAVPLVAFSWGRWLLDRWRDTQRPVSSRRALVLSAGFLLLALTFAVARNTTWGAWLGP